MTDGFINLVSVAEKSDCILLFFEVENMVIGTIPPQVATMEQLITWAMSELRRELSQANPSVAFPQKITEAQGYFPSDIISIQEISTIDGGSRHILRILMPVDPAYYGSSQPVYQFCGLIQP